MNLRVIHVVRDLDVASGGPSRSVPALARSQARRGDVQVGVLYEDRGNPVVDLPADGVDYAALTASGLHIRRLGRHFPGAGDGGADNCLVHLHGLWRPLLHSAARLARRRKLPYVVSTRGMLAGWALGHKAWKKNIAWRLYQRHDLVGAACLMASSEQERGDLTVLLPGSRLEAIPNGCEEPMSGPPCSTPLSQDSGSRWALAIGRLHPVKGYAELIEAWARVDPPGWKLAIAGPDEAGYRAKLEGLVAAHQLGGRVVLLGEVGEREKASLLGQCELFVAPSRTENFGMAIAEALLSGTPVITTTGTPWRELIETDSGWWVEPEAGALQAALEQATTAEAVNLRTMGAKGRRLVLDNYSWDSVADRTIALYRSILETRCN